MKQKKEQRVLGMYGSKKKTASDMFECMENIDRHVTDVGAFEEKLKI